MYDELDLSASSLEEFNRLIVSWQKLADKNQWSFHDSENSAADEKVISRVDNQANEALLSFVVHSRAGSNRLIDERLESFPGSVILVDGNSTVLELNHQASQSMTLSKGDKINPNDIYLNDSSSLNEIIRTVANGTNRDEQVVFKQIEFGLNDRQNLLAIVHSRMSGARMNRASDKPQKTEKGLVTLMVIDAPWDSSASDLVAANFGLTLVEVEIIEAFVTGVSLKQIAINRDRSYATIRNQFQSILEKTNSAGQTELLRMLLNVAYLFAQTKVSEEKTEPKCGKSLEIMRPDGRFVDVLLCGDLSGFPLVFVPSIFGHPVTPQIDNKLKNAGLCFVGIAPPGYGKSSLPANNQSRFECYCNDIRSVLLSLEAEKCVIVGRASAAPWVFRLTEKFKNSCDTFIVVNSLVPRKFITEGSMVSKWTNSLMSAARLSSGVSALILGSGQRLLTSLGAEKFISKMYSNAPSDVKISKDGDVAKSIEAGAKLTTMQGLSSSVEDMTQGFLDWSNVVEKSSAQVKLFQGELDPHVPISSSHALAKKYPNQVEIIEIKDGGGLLNYSHADELFSIITNSCDFEEHVRDRHHKEQNL